MSFLDHSPVSPIALHVNGMKELLSKTQASPVWPHEPRLDERDDEERVRKTVAVQKWRGLIS